MKNMRDEITEIIDSFSSLSHNDADHLSGMIITAVVGNLKKFGSTDGSPKTPAIQPDAWLYDSIKKLQDEVEAGMTLFFSEDGERALLMGQSGGHDVFVSLTKDEYATAGGKLYWARAGREEFGN